MEDDYIVVSDAHDQSFYHGPFGGLSVLRTVRNLCGLSLGSSDGIQFVEGPGAHMAEAFDSAALDLPSQNVLADFAILPSQRRLEHSISVALDKALNCKECVERSELWTAIQHLYRKDPRDYSESDRSMLALVYALLALGRRHDSDNTQLSPAGGSRRVVAKGLSYFRASRAIVDSLSCISLNSIMALCCLASYLLSASMISKAYACICTAVSSAMRIGLHVSSSAFRNTMSKEELTRRRRVFAVLKITDTIISSVLGTPNILRDADPDQMIPVPEEHLGDEGASLVQSQPMSPLTEMIISAKLYRILVSRSLPRRLLIPV